MYRFSQRSYDRMVGVRPELIVVATRALALSSVDFGINEGLRTSERQAQYVQSGASQTMRSRHLTGHAIDVVPYVSGVVHQDWPLYDAIAIAMKAAAVELRIPLEWGGDWTTFRDGPHYQLPWEKYPI